MVLSKTSCSLVEEVEEYFDARNGNDHGVPVTVIGVNIESNMPDFTEEFIPDAGMTLVADDFSKISYNQFDPPIEGGMPLFVVINGVANTNSHDQWEVAHTGEGFPGTETLRYQINSVQAGADTTPPEITINGEPNIYSLQLERHTAMLVPLPPTMWTGLCLSP